MTKKQLQFSTRGTYIAPECYTLEIKSQGIICQSGDMTIPDWQDDGNPLNF
jgi:hypothetical protein